jgi:hypothetical protein
MSGLLNGLSEADIQARCSEASFERGWGYFTGGRVGQRVRLDNGIDACVSGTYVYRVIVRDGPGWLTTSCTCPYDWGGDCKHIVATLLAWLHEPQTFLTVSEIHAALADNTKDELVAILADICAVYPHLVDELGLMGELSEYNPEAVVEEIFTAMDPPGEISIDEGVARMETVARHAARLARQGQSTVARRSYYVLTIGCLNFCASYGAYEAFPVNIPHDFVVAYRDLALDQLEEDTRAIEKEVRQMLHGRWEPEILGIDEPLIDVWCELGLC